jgi:hypothetical protein
MSSLNSSLAITLTFISLFFDKWFGLNFDIGISLKIDCSSTSRRGESLPPSPIIGTPGYLLTGYAYCGFASSDGSFLLIAYFNKF